MKNTRKTLTFGLLAIVALAAVSAAFGHPVIPPDALAGLGILPLMSGEIDMKEIKNLLDKQGEAWGEFTRKNDELLKAKAEGKAVADLQATVDKINGEFTKLNADLVELAKKSNRPTNDSKSLSPEKAEYKTAFGQWLRKGDDNGLADLQKKAYNAGSGPDGGYLVDEQMDTEILRVVGITSAIGRLARSVTIGTDTYKKVSKTSGMAARWVGPGATGGETATPKYAELEYTVYEAEAEPWIFNTTLADAYIDLETDLSNEAGIAFSEAFAAAFATGSGVACPRGVTSYDVVDNASYAWGKLGYVTPGTSGAFRSTNPGDDIIALQHSLKSPYRPGAAFVMADSVLSKVRQMKDGSGNFYLWQPDPLSGFGGRLLGSPVEIDDNMPTLAADSLSIAYGDFGKGYLVVNRSGTVVIRDNVTSKGKTKFNFRRRVGGGVQNFEAIKLMKFGTS